MKNEFLLAKKIERLARINRELQKEIDTINLNTKNQNKKIKNKFFKLYLFLILISGFVITFNLILVAFLFVNR